MTRNSYSVPCCSRIGYSDSPGDSRGHSKSTEKHELYKLKFKYNTPSPDILYSYHPLNIIHTARLILLLFPVGLNSLQSVFLENIFGTQEHKGHCKYQQYQKQWHILQAIKMSYSWYDSPNCIIQASTVHSMRGDSRTAPQHPNREVNRIMPPRTRIPMAYWSGIAPQPSPAKTSTRMPSIYKYGRQIR